MAQPKILWCWPEAIEQIAGLSEALSAVGEVEVSDSLPISASDARILVPRLNHTVNVEVLARLPLLQLIATPSTGTDHIDLTTARERGMTVLSLRDDREFLDSLQSTAELAWLLILSCMRRFRTANRIATAGEWNAMSVRGNELIGKTIGIVGLGRLGTMISRFALAFRMRVLACDVKPVEMAGVTKVELDQLLKESDIVSIHVHLNDTTRGLIGRREIELMKPGAILVNTARGAVVDEAALLDALISGHLGAAGLDVVTGERDADFAAHPLVRYARAHDHLILTPHVGGCTVEAQSKAFLHLVHRIAEVWKTLS